MSAQHTPDDLDTAAELEWWLDVLDEADHIHRQLPPSLQNEIAGAASERELGRQALHLASLSTYTRDRLRSVLQRLHAHHDHRKVTPLARVHRLRLHAPADERTGQAAR